MYPIPGPTNYAESDGSNMRAPRRRNPTACQYCRKRKIKAFVLLKCELREDNVCDNCLSRERRCVFLSVAQEEALRAAGLNDLDNLTPGAMDSLLNQHSREGHLELVDGPLSFSLTLQSPNQGPAAGVNATYPPVMMQAGQTRQHESDRDYVDVGGSGSISESDYGLTMTRARHVPHPTRQFQQPVLPLYFGVSPIQAQNDPTTTGISSIAPVVPGGNQPRYYLTPNNPAQFATPDTSMQRGNYVVHVGHGMHSVQSGHWGQMEGDNCQFYN
ncbi:hypothetical protein AX15_004469 [Amanita polypyramis BW_CC]|nr:hypothetical protein AX15_004469 [Amanita polypyramis BW_CC]